MAIFLDMDELLCDFTGAALRVHGYNWTDFDPGGKLRHGVSVWGLVEIMGMTNDQFWGPIHAEGIAFWHHLQKLPWADDLVALVQPHKDWFISTSPSHYKPNKVFSHIGKMLWLNDHYPVHLDRVFINKHKHKLAKPHAILVDDCPDNLTRFEMQGGLGVLFPCYNNRLWQHAANPIPYVKRALEELGCI